MVCPLFFTAAVVGGTASRLTGGKFQNAALTSGFQYLFNSYFSTVEHYQEQRELSGFEPEVSKNYLLYTYTGSFSVGPVTFEGARIYALEPDTLVIHSFDSFEVGLGRSFSYRKSAIFTHQVGIFRSSDIARDFESSGLNINMSFSTSGGGIASQLIFAGRGYGFTIGAAISKNTNYSINGTVPSTMHNYTNDWIGGLNNN